jgi:hypothetical protein
MRIANIFTFLLTFLIRAYQIIISPWTRASCRFHPTCSTYAIHAMESHGLLKGCRLTLRRLLRCHPFSNAPMYDPVKKKEDEKNV